MMRPARIQRHMPRRISRRVERLLSRGPIGAETLHYASSVVSGDIPSDAEFRDLLDPNLDLESVLGPADPFPRIRPVLVALAARAAGIDGDVESELQHAAELLHVTLVLHDLTLGQRGGRRRRVARRIVRRSVGLLGGSLTLRALELVRSSGAHPDLLGEMVDTLREISDGQALVAELKTEVSFPTEEDWIEHADAHNGALFSFCCRAGGRLGDADVATLSALGRYGRHLGRVWNTAEDLTSLVSDSPGQHLYTRALTGRPVLPVALAASESAAVGEGWQELVLKPELEHATQLVEAVIAAGGVAAGRAAMAQESWAALRALQGVSDSTYRAAMERLASGLARHV